jgi:uncharacterized protein
MSVHLRGYVTAATEFGPRILTLDVLRGVAVMGILLFNIVSFSMPAQAHYNPAAYGGTSAADSALWFMSFVLVDGRMRGLFALLFGASMMVVLDRAETAGLSPAAIHYRRLFWLLVFGLAHFYLISEGDVLTLYALVGMLAFLFRKKSGRALVLWALVFLTILLAMASVGTVRMFANEAGGMGSAYAPPTPAALAQNLALYRGTFAEIARYRLTEQAFAPVTQFLSFGFETLSLMLLGMAGVKSGFLSGAWERRRYRRIAAAGLGIGILSHAVMAWSIWAADFRPAVIFANVMAVGLIWRPIMVVGYAALIILLTFGGGWLVTRIAATGRAAFTNYLGTSLVVSAIFYGYGLGLYGHVSRVEAFLMVPLVWTVMLVWSKPWLERYYYGPFEWLWRSLSRWSWQPFRRAVPSAS